MTLEKMTVKMSESTGMDYDLITSYRNTLENLVNSLCFRPEKSVDAILKDKSTADFFTNLSITWIDYWANTKEHLWIDDRNIIATDMCKELAQTSFFQKMELEYNRTLLYLVKDISIHTHRTLVQTMSQLFFLTMGRANPELNQEMTKRHDRRWYRMPLI